MFNKQNYHFISQLYFCLLLTLYFISQQYLSLLLTLFIYLLAFSETTNESYDKRNSSTAQEIPPTSNDVDAGEYTSLKDTRETTKQYVSNGSEQPLLKSSDSEGSTSGSESTIGAVYSHVARLSKHSKEEEDSASPEKTKEKTKPRPPDPSTKPKVSWIHGTSGTNSTEQSQTPSPQKEKKKNNSESSGKVDEKQRSKEKSSKNLEKHQDGKKADGPESPSKSKSHKASDTIEHLNGTFQNALKKIGNFHSDKKTNDTNKDPPKSPKIMHPHMNSEAATLLAAQLKEKTQSLNRNDGFTVGIKPNGVSTPQANREKPTPPQKTKRSATGTNKPLIPTSSNLQKMVAPISDSTPEPKSPEQLGVNGTRVEGDVTPKKTPIKKPPRKKGKEGTLETEGKTTPKTAIMPPQTVK